MATGVSLLKPLGYQRSKECGYCKTQNGNCSYYISCDSMRVDHYEELMNRGWRRSGTTYYKPDLLRQCCPHYTIRLDASQFRANREQRAAVNKLNDHITGAEYRYRRAILAPVSREAKKQKRDKFSVTEAVHASEYGRLPKPIGKKSMLPIEPDHKFEITLESDKFTHEKHKILVRYQKQIHKDPESRWRESAFTRFLCKGLSRSTVKVNGRTMKLGSYHQCYRLDGKLIAVGVLDLLPQAVSSVYLFYDPDYSEWDWGKISALNEIALAVEGGYNYYYMGYYIHDCPKMRYKITFGPCQILDPERLEYNTVDGNFLKKLDQRKYVSLSHDEKSEITTDTLPTDITTTPSHVEELTKEKLADKLAGKAELDVDSDPSDAEDTDIPEGSLFDYDIPGVLTREDVEKLELGKCKLLVRDRMVELEDLRGWEEWQIDDAHTIKGICAELIAATGPALLKNSAISLF